jgi:hypothetical protein
MPGGQANNTATAQHPAGASDFSRASFHARKILYVTRFLSLLSYSFV